VIAWSARNLSFTVKDADFKAIAAKVGYAEGAGESNTPLAAKQRASLQFLTF